MRRLPVVLLALIACEPSPPPREFDGTTAFGYLEQQVAFGYRIPGTKAHAATAAWFDSLLRQRADTLVVQAWTHVTAKGDSPPARELPGPVQSEGNGASAVPGPLGHPPGLGQPRL